MDDLYNRKDRFASTGPITSPYLNFDPSILKTSGSQFIIPEGQGEHRGKLEMGFLKIGFALIGGGLYGGVNGLITGRRETIGLAPGIRNTQILNIGAKQIAASAQAFGIVALTFSLYDVLIGYARGVDDELNIAVSGAATGASYYLPRGYKKAAVGGVAGLALSACYIAYMHRSYLLTKLNS